MKATILPALLLSAGFLIGCPNQTPPRPPTPPIAPLSPEEPPAPDPVVGDPMPGSMGAESEEGSLSPGACEAKAGICGAASCEERGASEVEGTCYLQGEPQPNLICCDG